MEQVTKNIFTETKIRGCNPSVVFTGDGSVFIDTPQWISTIVEMREFAMKREPIKYLINTEGHIDHIFGNHWFAGEAIVVAHEKINELFWTVEGQDDVCYEYSVDIIKRQDAGSLHLMPSKEDYIVNKPQITLSERMTLKLGNLTFEIYHTPGHSTSQLCVYIPEEKTAFVGDTIFSGCQTWLHSAEIDDLLKSLDFIEGLDIEHLVPGHGPVVKKDYIAVQRSVVYEWIAAVSEGITKGWTLDECIAKISFADRFPVDIGQEEKMEYIQRTNVVKCYNYLTKGLR